MALVTAPDVRAAAQAEADKFYPLLDELGVPTISKSRRLRQKAFIKGAVWGAALVTPTREQLWACFESAGVEHAQIRDHYADAVLALIAQLPRCCD